MREIKFKVFNLKTKEWEPGDPLDEEGHCCQGETSLNEDCFKNPSYAVVQYTGLKDKNGKEIYEGDILAIKNHWDENWNSNIEVEFNEGCFFPFGTGDWEPMEKNVEVVGNIYENPELLNEETNNG